MDTKIKIEYKIKTEYRKKNRKQIFLILASTPSLPCKLKTFSKGPRTFGGAPTCVCLPSLGRDFFH